MYHSPKFPPLEKGEKYNQGSAPPRQKKIIIIISYQTLLREASPKSYIVVAHGSIIRVLTVVS